MTVPAPFTKHQADFLQLKYGMFLHFGPNTLEGEGWGSGKFPARDVVFPKLDPNQWADMAAEAGMKYGVLTAKHHEGFCLWPSRHTEYCVKNSPGQPDIIGRFVEAFRKAGLKTGIYYSLWDKNCPVYDDDELYAQYMMNQLTELLTNYGEIVCIWFDGMWDKDHPTREWAYDPAWETDPSAGLGHGERWRWPAVYRHVHRLQDNCLVTINSSSDRPGLVKYPPVDYRSCEQLDFIFQGKRFEPHFDPVYTNPDGSQIQLPLEISCSLPPQWFCLEKLFYFHPSVDAICGWHKTARDHNANLLLNVGPDKSGRVPEYHRHYFKAVAERLGLR